MEVGYSYQKSRPRDTSCCLLGKFRTHILNNHQADKLRKKQQYQTGVGLPSLPTTVGGVPLAQAQPRTAAQTVVRAAKGGSISDLYNEYSQLNNRMRNYRRLAKGGLI